MYLTETTQYFAALQFGKIYSLLQVLHNIEVQANTLLVVIDANDCFSLTLKNQSAETLSVSGITELQ